MSGLIGREREVSQLGELVRTEGVRLVTVTGPGGVGKTRVALAMSEAVQPDFDGGVVTVPLGAVSRADLLFPTIAGAVGVRTPKGDALVGLQGQLGNAELLLVLDDVEHLAPAALRLVELLDACPRLKVVSTSRTRLRLSPEREFPLAPLELPDCVTLFVERARAVRPDLDTSETGLREIELATCRRDSRRSAQPLIGALACSETRNGASSPGSRPSPEGSRWRQSRRSAGPRSTHSRRSSTTAWFRRAGTASRCWRRCARMRKSSSRAETRRRRCVGVMPPSFSTGRRTRRHGLPARNTRPGRSCSSPSTQTCVRHSTSLCAPGMTRALSASERHSGGSGSSAATSPRDARGSGRRSPEMATLSCALAR